MDQINILIIEDNPEISSELKETLEKNGYQVLAIAETYQEALTLFYKLPVDLVIVDIFLGENPEGITFAETISTVPNSLKPFIFLTGSKDRSIFERAKLTKPFRYLLKPFNELELLYVIEMAIEKFYEQPNVFAGNQENTVISDDFLFVKKKDSLKKVQLSTIIYIEVENRYCTIVTEKESFVIQISLSKILKYINNTIFKQVHRKFVVNLGMVEEFSLTDHSITLRKNHILSFSDKYKDTIKKFDILK
ncbi:LytR/AlgR family response regulator transcription factor [Tenacibaculum xiamenense]|uniref:LytR/AlgR family response regulator transcription factor n=1 Tax=Tenacibaculum xiamenense TaxID=1261553 RepID=UPI0038947A13